MNHEFLNELRRHSCYPAFRNAVGVFSIIGYILVVAVVMGGFSLVMQGGLAGLATGVSIMVVGVLVVLIVRVFQEMAAMMADLSDATIAGNAPAEGGASLYRIVSLKRCPFCAEDVRAEAVKCKHCGSELDDVMDEGDVREMIGQQP